jgi:uncharacterized protein YprB with RNaseH-like and TPR domain
LQDVQEQLALLRKRIARVDRKFAGQRPAMRPVAATKPERYHVDEWLSGEEVRTASGAHFVTERFWERHRRHGSFDVGVLTDLPPDLLNAISGETISHAPASRWAFLDTETTGLAGGSGTYAFLIGVGCITEQGFQLRQFFMRELHEETSLLEGLAECLSQFDVLVTYNGRAYDLPLLETRYRMARKPAPFERLLHLDLLAGARRLWKLRFDSCRLVDLENQIFGIERQGDLPGEMIPYVYFEYLRSGEATRLTPILHHNALDILTLACLTAVVPPAFSDPGQLHWRHATELVGVARWLQAADQLERAADLFRQALQRGLTDALAFRTLWDLAKVERRLGREDAALAPLTELAQCANPHQAAALEELAKFYEHRERNYALALEWTIAALAVEDSPGLHKRKARLERRLAARSGLQRLL